MSTRQGVRGRGVRAPRVGSLLQRRVAKFLARTGPRHSESGEPGEEGQHGDPSAEGGHHGGWLAGGPRACARWQSVSARDGPLRWPSPFTARGRRGRRRRLAVWLSCTRQPGVRSHANLQHARWTRDKTLVVGHAPRTCVGAACLVNGIPSSVAKPRRATPCHVWQSRNSPRVSSSCVILGVASQLVHPSEYLAMKAGHLVCAHNLGSIVWRRASPWWLPLRPGPTPAPLPFIAGGIPKHGLSCSLLWETEHPHYAWPTAHTLEYRAGCTLGSHSVVSLKCAARELGGNIRNLLP